MSTPPTRGWTPGPAMIVALIALVAALAGGAYAQSVINGADIKNKSIAGVKLKNQSVGTAQLRDAGVQGRDIQTGAITVSKLKSKAVTAPKIASGAVGTAAIAANAVTRSDLQSAARVPRVVVRNSNVVGVNPGGLGDAQVGCDAGETLIAGGAGVTSAPAPGIEILANRPEASGTRWQGIVFNGSAGPITFVAHAVCAQTSP